MWNELEIPVELGAHDVGMPIRSPYIVVRVRVIKRDSVWRVRPRVIGVSVPITSGGMSVDGNHA